MKRFFNTNHQIIYSLVIILFGVVFSQGKSSNASVYWMRMYDQSDFSSFQDLWSFLVNLQTGISPFWATVEVTTLLLTGSFDFVEIVLYKVFFIGMFVLPLFIFSKKLWLNTIILLFGVLFMKAGFQIHKPNPAFYDAAFPFTILCFTLLYKYFRSTRKPTILLCLSLGFVLSVAELTRPFMIFIIPFVLFWVLMELLKKRKKMIPFFLLPILLMSGGWHTKFLIQHKSITWTNHTGYNLMMAWAPVVDQQPELLPEEGPRKPGGMNNINTAVHAENSKILKRAILNGVLKKPGKALVEVYWNYKILLDGKTSIFGTKQGGWHIKVYPYAVKVIVTLFYVVFLAMIIHRIRSYRKGKKFDLVFQLRFGIMLFLMTTFLALGDKGEDARFLISVLPLYLCLPGLEQIFKLIGNYKSKSSGVINT